MTDRVRTTISLPPEIHQVFKRMADAAGMSVSRCMGDWLTDTGDAAEMITLQLEKARRAPMEALREMRTMLNGMGQQVDQVHTSLGNLIEREEAAAERPPRPQRSEDGEDGAVAAAAIPPSSNTGGKYPTVGKAGGGKSGKVSAPKVPKGSRK